MHDLQEVRDRIINVSDVRTMLEQSLEIDFIIIKGVILNIYLNKIKLFFNPKVYSLILLF